MHVENIQILLFRLNKKKYSILVKNVERVINIVEITRVFDTPDIILGVINIKGEIIPIADIKRRFGLKPKKFELSNKIVIAKVDNYKFGFVVDEILEYEEIAENDFAKGKSLWNGMEKSSGVIKIKDEMILITNLKTFLDPPERKKIKKIISQMPNA